MVMRSFHCGGIDPRNAEGNGGVVEQQARFEVVGAVQQQRESGEKLESIFGGEIRTRASSRRRNSRRAIAARRPRP